MDRSLIATATLIILQSLVTSLVLGPGCTAPERSIDATTLGSANQIAVYQGGKPILKRSIVAGSDEDKAVSAWLGSHEGGWRSDFNSYAPSRRVSGESFTLDFHKGDCVLNYRANKNGDWVQVSRKLKEEEAIPNIFEPTR